MSKLNEIKLFLLDMDGTIYLDNDLFDGTLEFLDYVTIDQIKTFMDIVVEKNSVCMVNNKEADSNTKVYENFEVVWKLSDKPQQEWQEETAQEDYSVEEYEEEN